MAWQEVETDVGTKKAGTTKYSVALKHGGARVSVPGSVRELLGWTEKTTLRLLVGGGETAGKLRIEVASKGKLSGRKPPLGGEGLIIRLGRWAGLAPRDVDAVTVDFDVDGTALIIALPAHAQAIAPPPRQATTIVVPATAAIVGKRDVTSQFFNDPKRPPAMASGVRGRSGGEA